MKIDNKVYAITGIIFSVFTIISAVLYFANNLSIDIVMLFLGFTQLFNGLNQIKLSQQVSSKGISKGNKTFGILSIVLGLFIISADIIKLIL
ncbi:MAG: hypothetical protein E7211_09200 [Clostridium lundense]|nr:hypothetical protein [Clostridium lundense]